ncbi:hypothetical protein [uncultured Sphingomonas sp.]|jgi:hypothetical protein|nr:hypothetical protein [uncultured Sphingomonas sp.]
MAHVKVFARRTLIVAAFFGGLGVASLGAWQGIAAAFTLGHYAAATR